MKVKLNPPKRLWPFPCVVTIYEHEKKIKSVTVDYPCKVVFEVEKEEDYIMTGYSIEFKKKIHPICVETSFHFLKTESARVEIGINQIYDDYVSMLE